MVLPTSRHSLEDEQSAALYALGTLDGDELTDFEQHLAVCPQCQQLVESDRQTLATLDAGVPVRDAPAGFEARLWRRLALELPPPEAPPAPKPSGLPRLTFGSWLARAVPLAAVLAVGLMLGVVLGQRLTLDQILVAVPLQGEVGGSSRVVVHRSGATEVELRGLADPAPGQVYVAWIVGPGQLRLPAGTYDDGDGTFSLYVSGLGNTVEITLEPASPGEHPTMPPLLWAQVAP